MADTISPEELFHKGLKLMEDDNYEKALKRFVYLRKHSKTYDVNVHFNIAKCYHQLGNLDEASDTFKEVISYSLDKRGLEEIYLFEAYHILGLILKEKREYADALEVFESLVEFQKRSNLVINEDVMKAVEQNIKECKRKAKPNIIDTDDNNRRAYRTSFKPKGKSKRKTYQKLKDIPKEEQRRKVEKMWKSMEIDRSNADEGSEWYIVSAEWFSLWKEWSGFSFLNTLGNNEVTYDPFEQTTMAADSKWSEPEGIFNEDIIEWQENTMLDQVNLKDNLNEDENYIIVSPEIWNYLYSIYDGTPIPRFAIKNTDSWEKDNPQCIIEVNLVKLYTFEVPRDEKQDFYEVLLWSREWTLSQLKEVIWQKKKVKENSIRLWKLEKPPNLDKFYWELEYEWKKYRTLRLDGMLFHDLEIPVKDADFSRDDFLMIEYPIPTDNNNGYAIWEVEKKGIHEAMDETTAKAISEDENLKVALTNPKTLEFAKISITILTKEESVKGAWGLSNLGNTCFMNSALQWMSQTQELTKYFLFNIHETEINHHNVLGSKGRVAEAYGELMKEMWCGTKRKTAPFEIKKSIGSVVVQFRGYNQQDSHEFLHYLIDILNEDLNRIKDKPYIEIPDSNERGDFIVAKEHWDAFCKRNDSVLVDLFYGQMKSHLVCLEWEYISNTFDPFSILSVPVPVTKHVKVKVSYFPINLREIERVQNFEIYINDNYCLSEIEKIIQEELKSDFELLFYTYESNKLGKRLKKSSSVWREVAGSHLWAIPYWIDKDDASQSYFILDIYMRKEVKKFLFFNGEDQIWMPFAMVISGKLTARDIHMKIFSYLYPILNLPEEINLQLSNIDSEEEKIEMAYQIAFEDTTFGEDNLYELMLINNREAKEGCLGWKKVHRGNWKLDFPQKTYKAFLNHWSNDPEISITWKMITKANINVFEKPDKIIIGEKENKNTNLRLDLDSWLNSFRQEEILDGENKWFCIKWKDHVKARKKMDLYKLPNILIIHLKRFLKSESENSFFRNVSRKITEKVDFPLRSLDLSPYLLNEEENKEEWIYDLYGVSNHIGKLHGGHYTASWYDTIEERWLKFDDSYVSRISEKEVVDPSAYILFYRKRGHDITKDT
jgi:ubiquitin carboxyl-terminal hydrolase 4/11